MIKNKQFKKTLIFAVLIVGVIALFDIFAAHSGVFGSYEDYSNGIFNGDWWPVFFKMNLMLILILPFLYYFLIRKDLSESIAIFLVSIGLWFSGLADIGYYWLQGQSVPPILGHLNNHIILGKVAPIIGQTNVTANTLYLSVILGFVILYLTASWLEKVN